MGDVERPLIGTSDLYSHPLPRGAFITDPKDGLPKPAVESSFQDNLAPQLQPETFVCMEDASSYVLWEAPFGELLVSEIDPRDTFEVVRERSRGRAVSRETLERLGHHEALGKLASYPKTDWWYVEPKRPQCEHYRRLMTDFEGQENHQQVERVCAAQRTEGGEYLSLRDTRVHACEHRSPRDFVSEERLRAFDKKIQENQAIETDEWEPPASIFAPRHQGEIDDGQ